MSIQKAACLLLAAWLTVSFAGCIENTDSFVEETIKLPAYESAYYTVQQGATVWNLSLEWNLVGDIGVVNGSASVQDGPVQKGFEFQAWVSAQTGKTLEIRTATERFFPPDSDATGLNPWYAWLNNFDSRAENALFFLPFGAQWAAPGDGRVFIDAAPAAFQKSCIYRCLGYVPGQLAAVQYSGIGPGLLPEAISITVNNETDKTTQFTRTSLKYEAGDRGPEPIQPRESPLIGQPGCSPTPCADPDWTGRLDLTAGYAAITSSPQWLQATADGSILQMRGLVVSDQSLNPSVPAIEPTTYWALLVVDQNRRDLLFTASQDHAPIVGTEAPIMVGPQSPHDQGNIGDWYQGTPAFTDVLPPSIAFQAMAVIAGINLSDPESITLVWHPRAVTNEPNLAASYSINVKDDEDVLRYEVSATSGLPLRIARTVQFGGV